MKKTPELAKPVWLKMSEEDLKKIIKKLAEKNNPAQIGLILRDQYGVPSTKLYGKKLGEYLEEIGIKNDYGAEQARKRFENLKEHTSRNITDKKAKHKLQKAHGRVNSTRRYAERKKK